VVIGVDPALSSGENSDETGIVAVGMDASGKAYVLDDLSIGAAPEIWAKRVAEAYHKYRARLVVMEGNAGGELLVNLLKTTDDSLKIKMVHAHTSKISRAEPVVILYQKKMAFHARQFQQLEMQMATYEPRSKSPDRLDALVWAMTEIFCINEHSRIPFIFTL
jgi:phage terminase large subunit-like protein